MHELKEKIRIVFDETDDWLEGLFKIGMWLYQAKKHFPVSQKTIIRWIDEIIAYFDNGTSSGAIEGINNILSLPGKQITSSRHFYYLIM
ncbi:MAG: transposase [Cyanobacteria bacterium P01_D01_bin.50]